MARFSGLFRYPSILYVGPLAVLLALLFLGSQTHWNPAWQLPVWALILGGTL